ncbi:MAG: hypothetical protein PHO92_02235 [Candidatus Peribacteraceae bacterium]|nr:hypothetical protein [Candidatus Peribacteraceae bacterium]
MAENQSDTEQAGPLDSLNFEAEDRMEHGTEVAAIMSEIRALSGQQLGRATVLRRGRMNVPQQNLSEAEARRHVDAIAENLFNDSRFPALRGIRQEMRTRFERILAARRYQPGGSTDQVAASITVGRALLDAVYEQIKATDLEAIALSILRKMSNRGDAGTIKNRYLTGNRLNAAGLELLERLRSGGANPAKAILAFSAALDEDHSDGGIEALHTADPNRINVNAVLVMPREGMTPEVYRRLQRIASATEAYKKAYEADQIILNYPGVFNAMGIRGDIGTAYVKHQEREDKFRKGLALQRAVFHAANDLHLYLTTPIGGRLPPLPTILQHFGPATLTALQPPTRIIAGTILLAPDRIESIFSGAVEGGIESAESYATNAVQTGAQQGLRGTEACDKILAAYVRRVGGVDEETAKTGLAALTGRVIAAKESIRAQRADRAAVDTNPDEAHRSRSWYTLGLLRRGATDGERAFNEKNKEARGWFTYRNPYGNFMSRLNQTSALGLPQPRQPMSPANSITQLMTRYYGLRQLTQLPADNERHVPMTSSIAAELTALRNAIVERQVRNVSVILRKKGIDRLRPEDITKMGLQGAHIENIPFDEVQDKLFSWLDSGEVPESVKGSVDTKIAYAFKPIADRKARSEWVRHPVKKLVGGTASALIGRGSAKNPISWPAKTIKGSAKLGLGALKGFWAWGTRPAKVFG